LFYIVDEGKDSNGENIRENQKQITPLKPNKNLRKADRSGSDVESSSDIEGNVDEESKLDPDVKNKQFPGMILCVLTYI
jgi:hypothetical protein